MLNDVEIGSLTLQISASAQSAAAQIDALSKALGGLNTAVGKMQGLAQISTDLAKFSQDMNQLTYAVGTFQEFKSAANAIKSTVKALKDLEALDMGNAETNLRGLTDTFAILQDVDKASGFTSVVNNLKKLPNVAKQLGEMDIYAFAADIMNVSGALEPLAKQMDRVSAGFTAFPQKLNAVHNASVRTSSGFFTLENRLNRLFSFAMFRRIGSALGDLITKSTQYVEDLNLFTVAMGKYADKAQEYAETVSETMGIDPAQWLRHQGVFQTLATGFGVTSDRAAIMSKNLTQLAYDLSSFYNLPIDKAMQKLESGFAGEIEPVRRLGYDLSKTALQATAADLGITMLFKDMTQAQKSQLRYYALMTQVTQVQGDMARTLEAPANQLRIFKAQLEVAARAIGNIFIPLLNAVLPYLIAFAKFVRLVADAIASFFGFKLPEIDYSGVSAGIGDVDDAMEDLDDSTGRTYNRAKKLKNLLASFDELNIIQSESGGGSGTGSGGIGGLGGGGWKDFELPEYDFLGNLLGSKADAILSKWKAKLKPLLTWVKNNFDKIWDVVKAIGIGLLGWKVGTGIARLLGHPLSASTGFGLGLSITGFALEFSGARNIGAGKAELWDYIKSAIGAALGIAGSLIMFGTGPAGWLIGIGAALTVFIAGFALGNKERVREAVDAEFKDVFEGALDPEEYADIVKSRFDDISRRLQTGLEIKANVDADLGELTNVLDDIDNFRLKLEGVGSLTSDEIDEMNSAFERLYTIGGKYIEDSWNLLENGLLNALNILPEEAHKAVSGYLSEIGVLESQEKDALQEYTEAYERAMRAAAEATPGSIAQQQALEDAAKWQTAIGIYTGALVDANSALAGAMARVNADIQNVDFDSMDSIRTYLAKVKEAYDESAATINDYWGGVIEEANRKLAAAASIGDDERVAQLSAMIDVYKQAQTAQLAELADAFERETVPVAARMAHAAEGMYDDAAEYVGNSSGWEKFWHGGADTWTVWEATDRAKEWYDSYLKPLADEMDKLGTPRATEVANAIRDGWTEGLSFHYNTQMGETSVTENEWLGYLGGVLDAVEGLEPEAARVGSDLGTALADGVKNSVKRGTDEVGRRLVNWWTHIRPRGGDPSDPYNWGNIEVTPFATGGIPKAGSLFLAGEGGGAELVGSMGNHTAVANGDQIVSGIAYGVQMANAEEASIQREMLRLLRQIAANGGNVVFSPSPEAGRAVQYALDMYATQRGY